MSEAGTTISEEEQARSIALERAVQTCGDRMYGSPTGSETLKVAHEFENYLLGKSPWHELIQSAQNLEYFKREVVRVLTLWGQWAPEEYDSDTMTAKRALLSLAKLASLAVEDESGTDAGLTPGLNQ